MLGLAWEDVDIEHGKALIAWQVQRVGGQLLRRRTKTPSSDAPLPLPDIAARALERHRVEEGRRRLSAGEMWGDCGLVFTTRRTCASLLVTLEVPPAWPWPCCVTAGSH
jgi:hypothetical protein